MRGGELTKGEVTGGVGFNEGDWLRGGELTKGEFTGGDLNGRGGFLMISIKGLRYPLIGTPLIGMDRKGALFMAEKTLESSFPRGTLTEVSL